MKYILAIALLCVGICAVTAQGEDDGICHNNIITACDPSSGMLSLKPHICNSKYGGIDNVEDEVQAYINLQLSKSYEYLLLASHFNSYQKNRPGFQKLYQGLSDRSFDDAIDMIKQLTRRGGKANFHAKHDGVSATTKHLDVHELESLAIALDNEKVLSNGAIHVHNHATHTTKAAAGQLGARSGHDPEMAHYIEEKLLGSQAATVRKLSGYANDLYKMMKEPKDASLALYLFDEYLQKQ